MNRVPVYGRFAWTASALLAIAAVPVLWLALEPRRVEDCPDPIALLDPIEIDRESMPSERRTWAAERTLDRVSGRLPARHLREAELSFIVLRTWGMPQALQNPSLALPGHLEPDHIEPEPLEVDGTPIPAQYAAQEIERSAHFAYYVYVYDGRAVASPLAVRLAAAPRELWSGSHPITLFAVSGRASRLQLGASRERARTWLANAWRHYRATCGASALPR